MRFTRPSWVTHQEQADQKRVTLYSCHVHPDGSRLATGGLDAKIRIWSTLPILDANADQEDVPKKLCTLTMHNGPVLCVRWSYSGKWLASGSDDAIVMIWDLDPNGAGRTWGNDDPNIEGWKPLKRLPGHDSDVTDLAWSPKDRYLASVGLDSKVIIWCGYTLDPLRKLDQHQGFVKGVCWDPVGEFLATQSDDKSVKVWRTTDWGLEATVTKPFQDSPGSTFFRRLSWSPDGAHITASNAMNNNGYVFVAAVIARNEWTSDICLVGHENTVEVAAYNPHIFLRDPEGDVQSTNICSVVALGADDLSVSIWQTKSPRPIIVTKEVFESPIYDLSWSTNGLTLYACSADGSLGVFDFDRTELDGIVGLEDKETYLQRFGFQPPPEAMPPQMKMHAQGYDGGGMNGTTTPAAVVQAAAAAAMDPGPAFDRKGRRRIKPVFISPLSTIGSFATSAAPAPYVPNASSAQPYSQPFPSANGHQASTSYPSAYPMDRSGVHHSQTDFRNSNQNMSFSGGFDTDGDTSMAAPANFYEGKYGSKRKASEMGDGDDASVSVSGAASSRAPKARTLGGDRAREPVGPIKELRPAISGYGFGEEAGGRARVRLVIPPLKSYITAKSDERDEDVFEGRNFDDGKPSEVSLVSGKQTQFLDYPPSAPLSLAVTGYFCACALEDCSLNVYSHTGRRLWPTVTLDSPCAFLEGSRTFLMAITASGILHVWNVKTQRSTFAPVSLGMILLDNASISSVSLRPNGSPVIILSSGTAYTFDPDLNCFTRLSEARWSNGSDVWESKQRPNKAVPTRGAVAQIETALGEFTISERDSNAITPSNRPQWWEAAYTLGHLETRQHAARALESPSEYKMALSLYARRIADEGFRAKAEELIKELCGPLYWKPGREEPWSPTVLGMQKRDLLKDVLTTFARSKTLAKLGQDWQDTLKWIASE